MPRTWDRSRFAPWLLREVVQVNEEPTSRLCRRTVSLQPPRARWKSRQKTNDLVREAVGCTQCWAGLAPYLYFGNIEVSLVVTWLFNHPVSAIRVTGAILSQGLNKLIYLLVEPIRLFEGWTMTTVLKDHQPSIREALL